MPKTDITYTKVRDYESISINQLNNAFQLLQTEMMLQTAPFAVPAE